MVNKDKIFQSIVILLLLSYTLYMSIGYILWKHNDDNLKNPHFNKQHFTLVNKHLELYSKKIKNASSKYEKEYYSILLNNILDKEKALVEKAKQLADNEESIRHYFFMINSTNIFLCDISTAAKLLTPIIIFLLFGIVGKLDLKYFFPIDPEKYTKKRNLYVFITIYIIFILLIDHFSGIGSKIPSIFEQLGMSPTNPYPYIRAIIIFPILEEIFYRGILYKSLLFVFSKLNVRKNTLITMFISSLAFSLPHIQYPMPAMIEVFITGLFLSFIRYKTKGVFPCIIAHSMINVVAIVISLLYMALN